MHMSSWLDGQKYHQIGSTSQQSQETRHLSRTAPCSNALTQHALVVAEVPPPPYGQVAPSIGARCQASNHQTSSTLQAPSWQNGNHLHMFSAQENEAIQAHVNAQTRNFQIATEPTLHQMTSQNMSIHSSPNMMQQTVNYPLPNVTNIAEVPHPRYRQFAPSTGAHGHGQATNHQTSTPQQAPNGKNGNHHHMYPAQENDDIQMHVNLQTRNFLIANEPALNQMSSQDLSTHSSTNMMQQTANYPLQNVADPQPHNGHFAPGIGTHCYGQTSNHQTSTLQQTPGGKKGNDHMNSAWENQAIQMHVNTQTNFQIASEPASHQTNSHNLSDQSSTNTMQQTVRSLQTMATNPKGALMKQSIARPYANLSQQPKVCQDGYWQQQPSPSSVKCTTQQPSMLSGSSVSANAHYAHTHFHNGDGYRADSTQPTSWTTLLRQMSSSKSLRTNNHDDVPYFVQPGMDPQFPSGATSSYTQLNSQGSHFLNVKESEHAIYMTAGTGQHVVTSSLLHQDGQVLGKPPHVLSQPNVGSPPSYQSHRVNDTGRVFTTQNGFNFHRHEEDGRAKKQWPWKSNSSSQYKQRSKKRNSSQINDSRASKKTNAEQPQTPASSISPNNGGSYTLPGHTGQRGVAIVQPLSQEMRKVATKKSCPEKSDLCKPTSTEDCVSNTDKFDKLWPGNIGVRHLSRDLSCESTPENTLNVNSELNSGGIFTTSSTTQTRSHTQAMEARLSNGKQCEATLTCDSENSPGDHANISVIPWTYGKLTSLIEGMSKPQKLSKDFQKTNTVSTVLSIFWENGHTKLCNLVNTGYYKDLLSEVKAFCNEYHTQDSVILKQMLHEPQDLTQEKYTALEHDCVHLEVPYMSSWLNTNEQLDDIDKDFGFPCSLKYCENKLKLTSTDFDVPANTLIEMPKESESHIDCDPVMDDLIQEVASGVPNTVSQPHLLADKAPTDSKDPFYSFEVRVLPPDVARIVFEQLNSNIEEAERTDNQRDMFGTVSTENVLSETMDVNSTESKKGRVFQMEKFCCVDQWIEMLSESKEFSLKCQCKNKMETKSLTVSDLKDIKETVQTVEPTEEEKSLANCDHVKENLTGNSTKIGEIVDLGEDSELIFEQEIVNILTNSNVEISTQELEKYSSKPELNHGCLEERLFYVEQKQTNDPSNDKPDKRFSPKSTSAGQENIDQCLASPSFEKNNCQSPCRKKKLHARSLGSKHQSAGARKKGRLNRKNILPFLVKTETSKVPMTSPLESAPEATSQTIHKEKVKVANLKPIKLALFGSLSHSRGLLNTCGRRYVTPANISCEAIKPPAIVSVHPSCNQKIPTETVSRPKSQIKIKLYREGEKSFRFSKTSTQNYPLSDGFPMKAEDVGTANTEKPPVFSKRRLSKGDGRSKLPSRFSKRKAKIRNGLKIHMEKFNRVSKGVATKEQENPLKSAYGPLKPSAMLLQENDVLTFTVLPNTFNFKDGPNGTNKTGNYLLDMSDCADANDRSPKKTNTKPKGAWAANGEKGYCPLVGFGDNSLAPKTNSTFQEFQRIFMDKRPSIHG